MAKDKSKQIRHFGGGFEAIIFFQFKKIISKIISISMIVAIFGQMKICYGSSSSRLKYKMRPRRAAIKLGG
jgi:hypothetical protein